MHMVPMGQEWVESQSWNAKPPPCEVHVSAHFSVNPPPPMLALPQQTCEPMQSVGAMQLAIVPPHVALGSWHCPVIDRKQTQQTLGALQFPHIPGEGDASGFPLASANTGCAASLDGPLFDEFELHSMASSAKGTQMAVARQTVALVMKGSIVNR